jgi:hypothetical protein
MKHNSNTVEEATCSKEKERKILTNQNSKVLNVVMHILYNSSDLYAEI